MSSLVGGEDRRESRRENWGHWDIGGRKSTLMKDVGHSMTEIQS